LSLTIDRMGPMRRPARERSVRTRNYADPRGARKSCLNLALINNMPDSALEETEHQFSSLLEAAAPHLPIRMKCYSLPGISREGRARRRVDEFYFGLDDLLNSRFDGVIITGAEPRHAHLQQEPHWRYLAETFEWAERNAGSVILSCQAAHASVLFSDGIERHPLKDKRFGLFDERKTSDHSLVRGAPEAMPFPHSRWNELEERQLISAGYSVLTKSDLAGPNLFVKTRRSTLFVYFQGHPEYGAQTLLREYRRDVGRFIRGERDTYPSMPRGYFDSASVQRLAEFQRNVIRNRHADLLSAFPDSAVAGTLTDSWRLSAMSIYHNWLRYVASSRIESSIFAGRARPKLMQKDARR
jgi:homoserine O-succinyltransferase